MLGLSKIASLLTMFGLVLSVIQQPAESVMAVKRSMAIPLSVQCGALDAVH